MKRKHQKTLELIYKRPVSGNVQWKDVIALLTAIGAELEEAEGSRVLITLGDKVAVQHRPHPSPSMDKGAVASMREFLSMCGHRP
ncbi:MAG: type II toxin-antitoxin system HicA family toxin [Mariprofundaceae bacterium]|nr:type II toxin-antitoxin system HicA family toxin [Mariprofundaceae bacterium]